VRSTSPRLLALLIATLAGARAFAQAAPPFPAGESTQKIEGLHCTVEMPAGFDVAKEHSLVVILHGYGGTDDGMARSLMHLCKEDFVVVAPKSTGAGWSAPDVEAVRRITADLKKRLHVGERRLHGIGFSNGGWNLSPVVFDEALRFQSACWVASGCTGGSLPKHAAKMMGVLALVGGDDPNRAAAEKTVTLLDDKVRTVECRVQPGLGHAWPEKLVPYLSWWLPVQEGRYTPGLCAAFEWKASAQAALDAAASTAPKSGSFVWWYSTTADATNEKAKAFQNDTTRARLVQHYGQQLAAAKADRDADAEGFAKAGLKATPAVVVYDSTGKVKSVLQDKIDPKTLAAALRAVAPDKSLPKE
jgi:poly(3-hydroxybutyrate) depolymerase